MLLQAANIFLSGTTLDNASDVFVSLFLIFLIIGFVLVFFAQSFNIFRKMYHRCMNQRKEAKDFSDRLAAAKEREEARKKQEEEDARLDAAATGFHRRQSEAGLSSTAARRASLDTSFAPSASAASTLSAHPAAHSDEVPTSTSPSVDVIIGAPATAPS
jgi:hypothetical protein